MIAVFKREWKSYFSGVMGYLLVGFMSLVCGVFFWANNLINASADFSYTIYCTTFAFLLYVPILTMRSFAEERRSKTDQLLLTSPVSLTSIVAGKFLAHLAIFALSVALMGLMPVVMSIYGSIDWARILGSLVCYLFLGGSCIAMGLWVSSQTESQLLSCLASFGLMLLAYLIASIRLLLVSGNLLAYGVFVAALLILAICAGIRGGGPLGMGIFLGGVLILTGVCLFRGSWLAQIFSGVLESVDLFTPFAGFVYGVFDLTSLVYYLTVTGFFLFLTGQSLEKRRWS